MSYNSVGKTQLGDSLLPTASAGATLLGAFSLPDDSAGGCKGALLIRGVPQCSCQWPRSPCGLSVVIYPEHFYRMVPGFLRVEVELPGLLRVRSRTDTVSLLPQSVGQSRSQGQPRCPGRGHGREEW